MPRLSRAASASPPGGLLTSVVPAWQALNDADAKVASTVLRIEALREDGETADQRVVAAAASEADAVETLTLAERALEFTRPALEAARALDARLVELDGTLGTLAKARLAAAGEAEASTAARASAVETLKKLTKERTDLSAWLDNNRSHERVSSRRDEMAADLAEHAEVATGVTEMQATIDGLATRRASAGTALSDAGTGVGEARRSLESAEREFEKARGAVPTSEAAAAFELERDRLAAIEPCLLAFERSDSDVARFAGAMATDRAEVERLTRQVAVAEARRIEIDASLPTLIARHDEALRAGALSAAASGDAAAQLRTALVPGEPCPVCGGIDHAVAALAGLLDGRAAADAERVAELAAEMATLGRERAVLSDRIQQERERSDAASVRIGGAATELAQALERREGASGALATVLDPVDLQARDAAVVRTEVAARLQQVDGERRRASVAREAERLAASALEAARSASTKAIDIERVADQAVRNLDSEHALADERINVLTRRRDTLVADLDAALAIHFDWREERTPVTALDRLVQKWRSRSQRLAAIDAELPGLTKAAHDAEIEHTRNTSRLEGATSADTSCREERDRLAADRATLFDGQAAADVAGRLSTAVEVASSTREARRLAFSDAKSAAVVITARHEQAVASLGIERADAGTRRATLERELTSKAVDIDVVAEVAVTGEAALETEARALAEVDRAIVVAETELRSRTGDRDAHQTTDAPTLSVEEMDVALLEATAGENAARKTLNEAEMVIRQDDRAREATAALRTTLEQERAAAQPWFQLDVLIGDATGNKFRRYAQGLTLERLLLHANVRLGELKPRYSLERAPGGDMLVQVVDNDMAGEVRGLPNLSGGERFLVSLALALGLSEMSTGQGLRVESLFIDEGFGALDSASLGQAIGVLEQLHATGRRVGVISHIEDVKERIAVKITVSPASNGSSAVEVQG